MITGTLADWKTTFALLPSCFSRAMGYIADIKKRGISLGTHELEGTKIYVNVISVETELVGNRRFEAHREYADIQILLEGRELHLYQSTPTKDLPLEDAFKEKDIAFYASPIGYKELSLAAGDYVVYLPEELHCPLCAVCAMPQKVHKLIVKVHRSLWEEK